MKTLLLALPILVGAGVAHADTSDPAIVRQLHDDSARAAYHAEQATEAARSVYDAQGRTSMAKYQWDYAVKQGHPRQAAEWAQRHFQELQQVRVAEWRLAREEYARDMAEKAFDADRVALEQSRRRTRNRG